MVGDFVLSAVNDDSIGGLFVIVAIIGGGWWLWNTYEIRERENTPPSAPAVVPTLPIERPFGFIDATTTETGTVFKLDANTVKGPRTARVGWSLLDHAKDKKTTARTTRELIWTNCETGEIKTLARTTYDKAGKVTSTATFGLDDAKSEYYPPYTIGAAVPREMCEKTFD